MCTVKRLAAQNHYPAVDVLNSVSRVMIDIVGQRHLLHFQMRSILATYREAKDMIEIGARHGTNQKMMKL